MGDQFEVSLDMVMESVFCVDHHLSGCLSWEEAWFPQSFAPRVGVLWNWPKRRPAKMPVHANMVQLYGLSACQDACKHGAVVWPVPADWGSQPRQPFLTNHSTLGTLFSDSHLQLMPVILPFVLWWASAQFTETVTCFISYSFFCQFVFLSSNYSRTHW